MKIKILNNCMYKLALFSENCKVFLLNENLKLDIIYFVKNKKIIDVFTIDNQNVLILTNIYTIFILNLVNKKATEILDFQSNFKKSLGYNSYIKKSKSEYYYYYEIEI